MSPSHRDQFPSRVVANVPLCREHFRLVLRVDASFPPTEPGQFVQISCRPPDGEYACEREVDWPAGRPPELAGCELDRPLALLRRPFSLAGRRDTAAGVELDIIHRVIGVGTDWLSRLRPGDAVDVLGPLGNRFQLPPAGALALLVGGGVGIPPMIYLAERLAGRPAVVFSGALTRDLLPLTIEDSHARPPGPESVEPLLNVAEFTRHGIPAVISTDDGCYGFRGYVTQALERYLDSVGGSGQWAVGSRQSAEWGVGGREVGGADRPITSRSALPTPNTQPPTSSLPTAHCPLPTVIYTCGPEPMMKRVAQIAAERGLECQVAVERAMACGMGTCQSCCIRVRKPDPAAPPLAGRDWCYRLACTDGPVFRGAELLW
jgi:dihydroorotate dehydrogenase electron transfer subunit